MAGFFYPFYCSSRSYCQWILLLLLPYLSDTQYTKKAFNTFTSVILEGDVSVDEEEVGDSGPVSIQKIEVNCLYLPSVVFKSSKGSGVE